MGDITSEYGVHVNHRKSMNLEQCKSNCRACENPFLWQPDEKGRENQNSKTRRRAFECGKTHVSVLRVACGQLVCTVQIRAKPCGGRGSPWSRSSPSRGRSSRPRRRGSPTTPASRARGSPGRSACRGTRGTPRSRLRKRMYIELNSFQSLRGSFSAVSTPIFARKYPLEIS